MQTNFSLPWDRRPQFLPEVDHNFFKPCDAPVEDFVMGCFECRFGSPLQWYSLDCIGVLRSLESVRSRSGRLIGVWSDDNWAIVSPGASAWVTIAKHVGRCKPSVMACRIAEPDGREESRKVESRWASGCSDWKKRVQLNPLWKMKCTSVRNRCVPKENFTFIFDKT